MTRVRAALTLGGLLLTAAPAAAAPLFAKSLVSRYWYGFTEYWGQAFKQQSAITLLVLGAGAVSMFIITRGKWRK